MLECRFLHQNSVMSQKKFFFSRKLEEVVDFILRMPETVGFACALSKILERSKSIALVLNIIPGSKSKILVSSQGCELELEK